MTTHRLTLAAIAVALPLTVLTSPALDTTPLVLRGTVLTPSGVLSHGYVGISNGRILTVSAELPDLPDAVVLNTNGIIVPGFVDAHNHVIWNVLPRWTPSRLFTNQPDWADDAEFKALRAPFDRVSGPHFCDMNTWGELRALVGGTTSILATEAKPCIHGLVRNLDFNSGFYGTTQLNRERVYNASFRFPPPSEEVARAQLVALAQQLIGSTFYEALALHLAEGIDAYAAEQFTFMQSQGLLNPKGVLIHGIPLTLPDFYAMADAGTALVWSPRSNLELYGATADIGSALDAGVEIALAPDWALTGSSNMLEELKVAAAWNRAYLGGRITARQLVDMATSIPARILGVDDQVGEIRTGLRADLLVIRAQSDDPWRAVVESRAEDVRLVVIEGVPLYGDTTLMERVWARESLETLIVSDRQKSLASSATGISVGGLSSRLAAALQGEGTTLSPLTEPGGPFKIRD